MKIIILLVVAFMVLWILAWYLPVNKKKRAYRQREYELKYASIQRHIQYCEVNEINRVHIKCLLKHLRSLKYKNPEKTKVLGIEFIRKFDAAKIEELENARGLV
jgi:hypothetical protein